MFPSAELIGVLFSAVIRRHTPIPPGRIVPATPAFFIGRPSDRAVAVLAFENDDASLFAETLSGKGSGGGEKQDRLGQKSEIRVPHDRLERVNGAEWRSMAHFLMRPRQGRDTTHHQSITLCGLLPRLR